MEGRGDTLHTYTTPTPAPAPVRTPTTHTNIHTHQLEEMTHNTTKDNKTSGHKDSFFLVVSGQASS